MGFKIKGNFKVDALKGEKRKEKIKFDDFQFLDKSCAPQARPNLPGGQKIQISINWANYSKNVEKYNMRFKMTGISK